MPEAPLYRLHAPTVVRGQLVRINDGPVEMTLPGITPRNSWEPLNEAARDAFRQRDAKAIKKLDAKIALVQEQIDEAKKAGAGEAELTGFNDIMSKLRLERAQLPAALKAVPTFGGAVPTHSLVFGADAPDSEAAADGEIDPRLEKMINILITGGASDADVAEMTAAFRAARAAQSAEPEKLGEPVPSPKKKKKGEDAEPKGESRASDS